MVTSLYALLTVLGTWPQVLHLGDGVRDPGDPLFNSWVLAWNAHKLGRGEVFDLFDANIFYPFRRTLAYSEHLFPQSLLVAPIIWLSGNPVLAHNLILLLAFLSSALGMFALARRFTGCAVGSFLAGVIFAFSPFMFSHLSHVQVLCAGGIPLTLLFLDRFLDSRRWRDAWLFALAFAVQILANGYYALFLSLAAGAVFALEMVRRRRVGDLLVWRRLVLVGMAVAAVTAPFFRQYMLMQKEMGFVREPMSETTLSSFLAAPPINRLYGKVTAALGTSEGRLFPGAVALALALGGIAYRLRRHGRPGAAEVTLVGTAALAVAGALLAARVQPVFPLPLESPERWAILAALLLAAAVVVATLRRRGESEPAMGTYVALGLVAFTLTFGSLGPYHLLAQWVPGFNGIRAVSRIHVLTQLVVALLAAWGTKALLQRWPRWRGRLAAGLTLALAVEYASVPVPLTQVSLDGEEVRVYRWLARVSEPRDPILELPFPREVHEWWQWECPRLLAATLHWRPMINGFSGYAPPLYAELQRRWRESTLLDNLADARTLGVRFVLVHQTRQGRPWPQGRELARQLHASGAAQLRQIFPHAWVFELAPRPTHRPAAVRSTLPIRQILASVGSPTAPLAVDGSLATRWTTERPQRPGDTITLDVGAVQPVAGVRLHLGRSRSDYPRGWQVELSTDGERWEKVAQGDADRLPLSMFLPPQQSLFEISFPATPGRFVRLTSTATHPSLYWSVHELEVFAGE